MYRKPHTAGSFYPADADSVKKFIETVIRNNDIEKKKIKGVILPHAGWTFSGETALKTLLRIQSIQDIDTFIIFGAVHTMYLSRPVLFDKGAWETPLGDMKVDENIIAKYNLDDYFDCSFEKHKGEHSVEVQLPFLKHLNNEAKIVPISIPNSINKKLDKYVNIFKSMKEENIIFISSTDLTHYGFRFGYTPKGTDQNALRWVKQEKDPGFINLIKNKKYKEIINYSSEHNSACGAGGVALITGILRNKKINLEEYTTSADEYPNSGTDSFVTYAGISFEEK